MIDRRLLELFPLPVLQEGQWLGGSVYGRSSSCDRCQQECRTLPNGAGAIALCPYGAAYARVGPDTLVAGLVLTDTPTQTDAQTTLIRRDRSRGSHVKTAVARDLVDKLASKASHYEDTLDTERRRVREEYEASKGFQKDALEGLSEQIRDVAAGIHDLWNLAHQVVANCKTIFELRLPGEDPDEAADQLQHEGAIYFTALQMIGKIEAALLLQEPSRMHLKTRVFRLHGLVSKHAKIYRSRAKERRLDLYIGSGSYGKVEGSPEAVSVVVQALVDNAAKYAPAGSRVTISFEEDSERVHVRIISLGPLIAADEQSRIFLPFVRGKAASETSTEGIGFGLAAAKLVSDEMDLGLAVN